MQDFTTRQERGSRQQGRLRNTGLLALTALLLTGLLAGTAAAQNQANAHFSFSDFYIVIADGGEFLNGGLQIGASSTLIRGNRGASMSVHAHGLEPGDAYTAWWIIFNNPRECIGNPNFPQFNCAERPDSFRPETEAAFCTAAGRVVDDFGLATFNAHLPMGEDQPNCVPAAGPFTFVTGLTSQVAEIHVGLRSHGQAQALLDVDPSGAMLEAALTTLFGGCTQAGGPNTCATTHWAGHPR